MEQTQDALTKLLQEYNELEKKYNTARKEITRLLDMNGKVEWLCDFCDNHSCDLFIDNYDDNETYTPINCPYNSNTPTKWERRHHAKFVV